MQEYSKPILTGVFNTLGAISVVIGVFLIVSGVQSSNRESVLIGAAAVLSSVLDFGLAQVVDYLAKSAHYAEQSALLLQRSITSAGARVQAQGRAVRNG